MEKFRAALEVAKKYHFWVLCGLIVILSFVSWFQATSDEESLYRTRKGKIDGQFGLVQKITSNTEHPSEKSNQEIRNRESGPLTKQVADASSRLYSEMRKANPLPRLYADKAEQKGFEAAFEKKWMPIEQIEKLTPREQLEPLYRTGYRNHIEAHFPELLSLIELRTDADRAPPPPAARDGSTRGTPDLNAKTGGIVDWFDADLKKNSVVERLPNNPDTLDVMMAQEDLWIYETLLKVIRYTNNLGPDREHYKKPLNHKTARIKQILAMDIGKDAVDRWSKCETPLFSVPSGGDASTAAAAPTPPADRGAATSSGSRLAGRYVDDMGKPLADGAPEPFNEFRMMPINLKVVIEQREIPRFLAECANSAMRIDVRRLRILVDEPPPVDFAAADAVAGAESAATAQPATASAATPAAAATPAERPRRGRRLDSRGGSGAFMNPRNGGGNPGAIGIGGGGGNDRGDTPPSDESSDPVYPPVTVEVQGIVYIYNPPPRVLNPGGTAGDNSGQTAPATPNEGTPAKGAAGTTIAAPASPGTNLVPGRDTAPTTPAPAAAPTNPAIPATKTPASGGSP